MTDAVIGAALNDTLWEVHDLLVRFVVFARPEQPIAITLWVAHTYAIDAAEVTPYLHLHSAEMRSGKTRTLDVLALLVKRPWRVAQPSEAVTFRKISRDQPTVLMDEVDTIFANGAQHEGLRALLNAGYQRGTTVPRCVGPRLELQEFEVFGAKALAGIGRLPGTIEDRTIPIRLKRRRKGETAERFRRREVAPAAERIRHDLERWAAASVVELRDARPPMPQSITDRAEEAWEPLVAIADAAAGPWPELARNAAIALPPSGRDPSQDTLGVRLLADTHFIIGLLGMPARVSTTQLLEHLLELDEAPWATLNDGQSMTTRRMADILRQYDIKSRDVRTETGTRKAYPLEAFRDAWERYLPELPVATRDTRDSPVSDGQTSKSETRDESLHVAGSHYPWNSHLEADVAGVASPEPNLSKRAVQTAERESFDLPGAVCPYPLHRPTDWQGVGGQKVCGVCHPPASQSAIRR